MTPKFLISLACGTALLAFSQPVLAKDPSPKKLLEMSAGCAYVVSIAEGSDVSLNYGSAEWIGLVRIIEQRTGLDGEKAIQTAKAKYNKRARVMGADEARSHMLDRARECDREMAVIQS